MFSATQTLIPFNPVDDEEALAIRALEEFDPEKVVDDDDLAEKVRSRALAQLSILSLKLYQKTVDAGASSAQVLNASEFTYKLSGLAAKAAAKENANLGAGRVIINFVRAGGRESVTIDHPSIPATSTALTPPSSAA